MQFYWHISQIELFNKAQITSEKKKYVSKEKHIFLDLSSHAKLIGYKSKNILNQRVARNWFIIKLVTIGFKLQ